MVHRALAVVPENAHVFLKELDLTIDYETIDKDYLVHGFEPPMEYIFYTKEEFEEHWRFFLHHEKHGQFSTVIPKEGNPDG